MTHTGSCLCGAVTFTATELPDETGACHCQMCRKHSGGVFLGMLLLVTDPATSPRGNAAKVLFGFAYGVHYKKVGSWIQSPSGGMNPNVDELSMGAVSRMEAKARAEDEE